MLIKVTEQVPGPDGKVDPSSPSVNTERLPLSNDTGGAGALVTPQRATVVDSNYRKVPRR